MKHALKILSRFILVSIILVLVLGALLTISRYVIGYDPAHASTSRVVVDWLGAMREVFPASILLAGSLILFTIVRSGRQPFVSLVLVSSAWIVLLVVGTGPWPGIEQGGQRPAGALLEDRIIQVSGAIVFSPGIEGLRAAPLLLGRPEERPALDLYPEGVVDPETMHLTIPGRPELSLDLRQTVGSYPSMVTPPRRIVPLLRDLDGLNDALLRSRPAVGADDVPRPSLLFTVVLGLFLLSCWTLARLTRWPLFNAVLVFLAVRAAVWLVWAIHFGQLTELAATVASPGELNLVTTGVLAFVALVLFVTLFLLPPFSSWKREVTDE